MEPISIISGGQMGAAPQRQKISRQEESPTRQVSLEEMLKAREFRAAAQQELLSRCRCPLISFTLNIPGPDKTFPPLERVFLQGCEEIRRTLKEAGIPIREEKLLSGKTGYGILLAAAGAPLELKDRMTALEDGSAIGRLFDIDVLRTDGTKISREELGLKPRTCLLCGRPAHACSRSRAHTVAELTARIRELAEVLS